MPTFYDRFRECAARWPNNPCLEIQKRDAVESYTYAEVQKMAESVGQWLSQQSLELETRVAILADNHPRWVASYLGIIAAGFTAVPLDTAFHTDQVAKLLKDSGTKLIFCDEKHLKVTQEAIAGLPVQIVLTSKDAAPGNGEPTLDSMFAAGPGNFKPIEPPDEAVASLLYTSGTTADPKGVMLTHGNLFAEADSVFKVIKIGPEDSILGLLPLFHVLSQMANLLLPLVSGTRVVYLETLNTTELLRALQEREITIFCVVPQFFNLIHDRIFKEATKKGAIASRSLSLLMKINLASRKVGINLGKTFFGEVHKIFGSKMRYLITGGSRFSPEIATDFYALGIDVLQAYGLTETSGGAFITPPGGLVIGSVGKALPGLEAKIDNPQTPDDGGPPSGEIILRGAIVMKGYWNRPDATEAVMKDGWFHSGDLGHFDSSGNLFITGRQKDVIVLESFSAQLASTKRIANYEIWQEELPRTTTRKLKRFEIEKRVLANLAKGKSGGGDVPTEKPLTDEDKAWLGQEDVQRAIAVIREAASSPPEQIRPDSNLELDLGFDSMGRVELLVAIEQAIGGNLEESRLAEIYNVKELVDAIRESAASGAKPAQQPGWKDILAEDPTDPTVLALGKSLPVREYFWQFVASVIRVIAKTVFRLQLSGAAKLPQDGPYIICSNHQSYVDPAFLAAIVPGNILRRSFAVGTSEIFGGKIMRKVAASMNVVVVDPDANLIPAMRAGAYGLRHGRVLVLYPEGERSIDGTPKTFKKGAAILSINLQVPIVPVAIEGFHDVWPRGKGPQKFAQLKIKIGDPIVPPPESAGSEEAYAKLTAEVKARVVEMWETLR
ncbi:MAG: AMP-binding protein [Terriglobales bacterium]